MIKIIIFNKCDVHLNIPLGFNLTPNPVGLTVSACPSVPRAQSPAGHVPVRCRAAVPAPWVHCARLCSLSGEERPDSPKPLSIQGVTFSSGLGSHPAASLPALWFGEGFCASLFCYQETPTSWAGISHGVDACKVLRGSLAAGALLSFSQVVRLPFILSPTQ